MSRCSLPAPAPWEAFDLGSTSGSDPAVFSGKSCIATVWINGQSSGRADANARLMAAAPDLLTALKALVENPAFELGSPKIEGRGGGIKRARAAEAWDGFVDAARAAIAKAEGRDVQ